MQKLPKSAPNLHVGSLCNKTNDTAILFPEWTLVVLQSGVLYLLGKGILGYFRQSRETEELHKVRIVKDRGDILEQYIENDTKASHSKVNPTYSDELFGCCIEIRKELTTVLYQARLRLHL